MSKFSSALSSLIQEKGETVRGIARRLGVSPSTLIKICNGSRSPRTQTQMLNRLYDILMLTPQQRKQLATAQQAALLGPGVYATRMALKDMIENMQPQASARFESLPICKMPAQRIAQTAGETGDLLSAFISSAARLSHKLDLALSVTQPSLLLDLRHALASTPVKVRQLQLLQTAESVQSTENAHNISCISALISLLLTQRCSGAAFDTHYYYGRGLFSNDNPLLLPNLLISPGQILCCSVDYTHAIYSRDDALYHYFSEEFEKQFRGSRSLAILDQNLQDQVARMVAALDSASGSRLLLALEWQPCFLYFMDKNLLYLLAKKHLPQARSLIDFYYNVFLKRLQLHPTYISYFTLTGLRDFIRTGVFRELPAEFADCVAPPEIRRALLQKMSAACRRGEIVLGVVREDEFQIPKNIQLISFGADTVILLYLDEAAGNHHCFLEELTTNVNVLDFLENFGTSGWVYPKEEGCRLIAQEIAQAFPENVT